MPVKITSFEAENVKRVKAVAIEPTPNGLTVIGGRNGQGKTSVLDAIAWTLGGNKRRPTDAKREGSATDPHLKIQLSNGLVVERKGKNGDLKVIDPEGRKSGQSLLDGFIAELALDLPKFIAQSDSEKAKTLLNIIGVGDQLYALEQEEQTLYNQRTSIGQMRDQKRSAADEMPTHTDAPAEPVSAVELIKQQQTILAKNGENQAKRQQAAQIALDRDNVKASLQRINEQIQELITKQQALSVQLTQLDADTETAAKTAEQLQDESTEEIKTQLEKIEEINAKVRTNAAKAATQQAADELADQYADMSNQIEAVRSKKLALLKGADLPLDGLSVKGGVLVYNERKWDCMSGSEQLRVATAIIRKLNPECGFVLVDKLEQMDSQTLAEFGAWAEAKGLQVIATRVSTGDECSIVIEDGYVDQGVKLEQAAQRGPEYADAPTMQPATAGITPPSQVLAPATGQWVM